MHSKIKYYKDISNYKYIETKKTKNEPIFILSREFFIFELPSSLNIENILNFVKKSLKEDNILDLKMEYFFYKKYHKKTLLKITLQGEKINLKTFEKDYIKTLNDLIIKDKENSKILKDKDLSDYCKILKNIFK